MMMKRRRLTTVLVILLGCLLLAPTQGVAQEKSTNDNDIPYNWAFTVHPLHIFSSGLRIDVERKLHKPNHWLVVGLSGTYLPHDGDDYNNYSTWSNLYLDSDQDVTKLIGAGIDIAYKYFFPMDVKLLYISGSINYNYFKANYYAGEFFPYEENGLTYYERDYREVCQQIDRIGSNLLLGVQLKPSVRFHIDGFAGIGFRYGIPRNKDRYDFDSHIFSLGYRGITFTTGMRIGFRAF